MKLKSGDLVTAGMIAPDVVPLYDRPPSPAGENLNISGRIKKGDTALVISSNSDSTVVFLLGTTGYGYTFGAAMRKVNTNEPTKHR